MFRCHQRVLAAFRLGIFKPQRRLVSIKPDVRGASPVAPQISIDPRNHWPPRSPPARYLVLALGLVLAGHIWWGYVLSFNAAYGISMIPTFAGHGDWVFISKYYRRGRDVQVGDVVSFKHPLRVGEFAIKRIIGMEGDFVLMYTPGKKNEAMIQVPEGHCWVVGDNLTFSRDSRMFGPLPLALISGKVQAKISLERRLAPEFSWVEHGLQPGYEDEDLD